MKLITNIVDFINSNLNSPKNVNMSEKENNHKEKIIIKNEFELLRDKNMITPSSLSSIIISEGLIDKDSLYNGFSDSDIKNTGIKVYMFKNVTCSCNVIKNLNLDRYEIYLNDYSNTLAGYLDKESNELFDKISNKEIELIRLNGISFDGGRYKYYDDETQKIVIKSDKLKPKLIINYEIEKED